MRILLRSAACLVALLSAVAPAPASARAFHLLRTSADAWTVLDPDAIERLPDSGIRRAWSVRVQRNILTGNPPEPGYVRTLTEYDCAQRSTRWREFSAYSRAGRLLVSKVNPEPEWTPAAAALDSQAALRVVCEGRGADAAVVGDSIAKVVIALMNAWDIPPAAGSAPKR